MSRAVTEEEMTQGISRLEAHTAQIMEEAKARGIAVGVVDRTGRILYEKYFGYRDEEKKLPINRDTIFGMVFYCSFHHADAKRRDSVRG